MMYTVTGSLRTGRETTPFKREVDAGSEQHARELVFSQLGSEHSVPRNHITIDTVEA